MHLQTSIRSLMARRALILAAVACYLAIFGVLIYSLAIHARPASWRHPPLQTTAIQTVMPARYAIAASCAEFAGMGQRLCNAEAEVDAARVNVQQRVKARKQPPLSSPAGRAIRAPASAVQTPITFSKFPDQVEPLNLSIAVRE